MSPENKEITESAAEMSSESNGKSTIQSRNIIRNSKITVKTLNYVIIGGIIALIIAIAVLFSNRGFTVTFNMDGGSSVEPQKVMYGEYLEEPPTPVKEGYIFGGWYLDEACTKPWNFSENTVSGSMDLYAKWIKS